jgi:dTDP-4-dehydrorhamnose 3,5-epimerase
MIGGVVITPLRQIADERGKVMHMLRSDAAHFSGFGEIYFSTVVPGAIKAWHLHRRMTLNYAVPQGRIRFVLFDDRVGSNTRGEVMELSLGGEDYRLVTVPPLVWNGFACIGSEAALVANCASIPHDPAEIDRRDATDPRIPYDWNARPR